MRYCYFDHEKARTRSNTSHRYIIDRYNSLPGNIVFHHAERFQWHNDNPDYDALALLQRFRFDYLKEQGYANLRCAWVLGCPAEINPIIDATDPIPGEPVTAKRVYKRGFEQLFPGEPIPEAVGVTCCSQFAVRRETIRMRPRADYIRYRRWLIESDLHDQFSGRVLEYSWHSESLFLFFLISTFWPQSYLANFELQLTGNSNIWQKGCALPQCWRVLLQNVRAVQLKLRQTALRWPVYAP